MTKTPQREKAATPSPNTLPIDFPIVGVGASAGGLEAMEAFFRNVPTAPPMAFVVIQHMAPNQEGYLTELLQRATSMLVLEATDDIEIEAQKVYVIPPNKAISLRRGRLSLSEPRAKSGQRLPIDLFFQSLAAEMGARGIGIVLSGMGSDGSRGMLAIHKAKGLAMLQSSESAKFTGMPTSAAKLVPEAIVGSAEELAVKLVQCLRGESPEPQTPVDPTIIEKESLDKIISSLLKHSGHDFTLYKKNTLVRRIERRKSVNQIGDTLKYAKFLLNNASEVGILFKELLIGVTQFFRDAAMWETLKDKVLPDLIARLPSHYCARIWVPACSTGEEAYSLAIVFNESVRKHAPAKNITLQIFATDLDADAIDRARKGFFPRSIEEHVSSERLDRFFVAEENRYRISPSIREMIVFAVQSVTADPPFTKLDLLSCRNLLIYLEPQLQRKLISLFHYSIRPRGIMILGTSESLGAAKVAYRELDSKYKIFERIDVASRINPIDFPSLASQATYPTSESENPVSPTNNIQTLAEQAILQYFAPPSVLVNSKGDIVYVSGKTGKYLEPAVGKANWNIHAMARKGLRDVLPAAFRSALESGKKTVYSKLQIGSDSGTQVVDVSLQRIDKPPSIKGMVIIVFEDQLDLPEEVKTEVQSSSNNKLKLEAELQRSYEELQRTREDMQTSQEELKSMNEELQSTNEELQSTNEELTTSKEEMQSLNEELQTVNIELQNKMSEYVQANDDMTNLLNSTEIATLFLDKNLHVRRFTDQVTKIFKLRDVDIGRPFTELVTDLQYPEIDANARGVLKTLTTREDQVTTNDGRWFTARIMPYRTVDDLIDGIVITFSDISVAKKLELDLVAANEALSSNPQDKGKPKQKDS